LCVVWGFVEPWLGSYHHVAGEVTLLGAFLNLETPIFLAILVPTGLIIYLTYYRNSGTMMKIRSPSNPLTTVLKHGYFFDDLYENIIAKGTVIFSSGVRFFENTFFGVFPQLVAGFVISFALNVHKYLDVLADQLLNLVANKTLSSASKMKKVPAQSLQHYLAAALLGFILILILIIATIGV
jgi:hypothetical protein